MSKKYEVEFEYPHKYALIRSECGSPYVVAIDCGNPFCMACEAMRASERRKKWEPVVRDMHRPRMFTLTMRSEFDLDSAWQNLHKGIRSLLDMSLGERNLPKLLALADSFEAKRIERLEAKGAHTSTELAYTREYYEVMYRPRFIKTVKRLQTKSDKPLRFRELVGDGFISKEITYNDDKGWHVHCHGVSDGEFIPQSILTAAWFLATRGAGEVVDIRAVNTSEVSKSMRELVKYLCKVWDIPEHKKDEFAEFIKYKRRLSPLGDAHPVVPVSACPVCKSEECKGHYKGKCEFVETIELPGGDDGLVLRGAITGHDNNELGVFVKRDGVWQYSCPLNSILKEYQSQPNTKQRIESRDKAPPDRVILVQR